MSTLKLRVVMEALVPGVRRFGARDSTDCKHLLDPRLRGEDNKQASGQVHSNGT